VEADVVEMRCDTVVVTKDSVAMGTDLLCFDDDDTVVDLEDEAVVERMGSVNGEDVEVDDDENGK
jgi:hypothetical protein